MTLQEKIAKLKKEKNALILAHYYQRPEVKLVADFVGDSLGLSFEAAKSKSPLILFAGVKFMAETAKIICPSAKVILPDLNAGCSLEASCPIQQFKVFRDRHPDHIAVTYINCSAEVKAASDIICTSSNAVKIINSLPFDQKILFAPDVNLGKYLQRITHRNLLLWDGVCEVHQAFSLERIEALLEENSPSKLVAHPESELELLKMADFVGSTSAMSQFVGSDTSPTFIIATEMGLIDELIHKFPNKKIIPAPVYEKNACSCSECAFMKLNTLEKVYLALKDETPEIVLSDDVMRLAIRPIERMLSLS